LFYLDGIVVTFWRQAFPANTVLWVNERPKNLE
jgi:hypothetical protein